MQRNSRRKPHQQQHEELNEKQKTHKQSSIKQKQQKFSLYLFLQVNPDATPQEIKKQYRRLVLKYHPDKNQGDPTSKEKFQKLKQAFDILSDPEKRKIYDQTGTLGSEDQFDERGFQTAYEYFRTMFKKVSKQDIDDFTKKYPHSQMEEQDLLNFYEEHNGDMTQLIESIPLSTNQDIKRFIDFFQQKIKQEVIQRYKNFDKTKKKVRLLKDQTQQFQKQMEKEKKNAQLNSLVIAIQGKGNKHKDFLASLQEKYGGGKKKSPKRKNQIQMKKRKRKIKKLIELNLHFLKLNEKNIFILQRRVKVM